MHFCRNFLRLSIQLCVFAYGQQSECPRQADFTECSDLALHSKYRSINGRCNNMREPGRGAAGQPLLRLLPAQYEDGFGAPVGAFDLSYSGYRKPNPRLVSQSILHSADSPFDLRHTAMLAHWGQFLAHDISLEKEVQTNCSEQAFNTNSCYNMDVPAADRFNVGNHHFQFKRSRSCNILGRREQMNSLTAFIDASQVYGSSAEANGRLRERNSGRLVENSQYRSLHGLAYPAFDTSGAMVCHRDRTRSSVGCFMAGDVRANEQLALTALHTLFLREHNRIADRLARLNTAWSAETLFQETRKIVGAVVQHISFDEWLPEIVGPVGMRQLGDYAGYDAASDAGVANAVATGAMRFGHAFVGAALKRLDRQFRPLASGDVPLRDAFFAPFKLLETGIEALLRGAVSSPVKSAESEGMLTEELTNHLFPHAESLLKDLGALNIQRGRDHGLPPWNAFRSLCGFERLLTWQQVEGESRDARHVDRLAILYGHPDNIDFWIGGLLEKPLRGAVIGRTFTCLLMNQFSRLRSGDRFWYENPGIFGTFQQASIKSYSLSKLLCNNMGDQDMIPRDAFVFYSTFDQHLERCDRLPDLNLTLWQHDDDGFAGSIECTMPACRCRYRLGRWRRCTTTTTQELRVDELVAGASCTNRRVVARPCGRPAASRVVPHLDGKAFNGHRQFGNLLDRRRELLHRAAENGER